MNEALAIRRNQDLIKLRELQARIPNIINITGVSGNPPNTIKMRIMIPTAFNRNYPQVKRDNSEVEVSLPEQYPFPPGPLVNFLTPIWNPNVYLSGRWCFGEKWTITENLELFIIRLMRVVALDPLIINTDSPANREAALWFLDAKRKSPNMFPTIDVAHLVMKSEKPKIGWRNL